MKIHNALFIGIVLLALGLRTYKLDIIPPSLNWDEAAIAWNGYSIGQTHLDEYGTKFPLTFRSFGDYKAPGFIYLTAVVTRLFGLSIWTIRLPTALIGVVTVSLMYFLGKEIGRHLKFSQKQIYILAITSMFFMSISPWHIFFSRGAFEANLALGLSVSGIWLLLLSLRQIQFLPLGLLSWVAAMYSYHSPKLFLPLFGVLLLIIFGKQYWEQIKAAKWHNLFLIIGLVLIIYTLMPLINVSLHDRGAERLVTSIFYDDKQNLKPIDFTIIGQLSSNFVKHLDPKFLLVGNRLKNYRTELMASGKISLIEYLFVIIGLVFLFKKASPIKYLLIFWIMIAIIPAAIGKEVPHGIRSLALLPAVILLAGIGFTHSWNMLNQRKILLVISIIVLSLQGFLFINDYFYKFPIYAASDWQYGMESVAKIAQDNEGKVDKIIITSSTGQPHVLTYVYQTKNPIDVIYGEMGKKYQFRQIKWEGDQFCQRCLLIGTADEIPHDIPSDIGVIIAEIKFPDAATAFRIVRTYN